MKQNMWKAAFILVGYNFFIKIFYFLSKNKSYDFSMSYWLLALTLTTVLTICSVVFIYLVKEKESNISIFGFIWRSFISFNLAIFLSVSITISVILDFNSKEISIENILFISFLQLLSIIFISWLFYSSNRKKQLLWLTNIFNIKI